MKTNYDLAWNQPLKTVGKKTTRVYVVRLVYHILFKSISVWENGYGQSKISPMSI